MTAPKPTFLLVPGAWHHSSCYNPLLQELSAAGYPAEAIDLPSFDPSEQPSTLTCANDAEAVRQKLLSMIQQKKHVIVVTHSYGGIPGGCAAHGLMPITREKGGVIGLVYMSALGLPEGTSLLQFFGGKYPPFVQENEPSEGLSCIAPARETLYNDVDDAVAGNLEKSLRPHSTKAFESPSPASAWTDPAFRGKLAFLRCTLDNALPVFLQDMFMQRSGAGWIVNDVEAGHSAFVSKTKDIAKTLTGLAAEFSF